MPSTDQILTLERRLCILYVVIFMLEMLSCHQGVIHTADNIRQACQSIHRDSVSFKKTWHYALADNLAKSWLVFTILSPLDSAVNLQHVMIKDLTTSQTWNLVKSLCTKNNLIGKCSDQNLIFLEQFYAAPFKLYGLCIIFITVNILTNLCHHEYSKCPILAGTKACNVCTTGHAMASSIMLCFTPAHSPHSSITSHHSHSAFLKGRLIPELYSICS